ncbi:hypothetical protein PR202_gb04643 [Eleusine coracana subsp. coracana]|uniref:dCMP deaminase n=1 Tax=Eleusine coracana subsp. coracana TaxID=191504 RepID=A0AAV5E509_ELECO|nr:hypothetical protein PR202_gb04643 [Eleusine coracana subsp. coracana]
MALTRDLALALISAAAGAAAAAAALRFLSACRTSSPGTQNQPLAANGSAAKAKRSSAQSPFNPAKREGYISWDDYFMAIAFLSAERSKDPNRQVKWRLLVLNTLYVGACLVSQGGIILGIGYNGFPRGCSDNKLPWAKKSENGNPSETKYPYVVHAEVNAILNTNHASVAGQKVYWSNVLLFLSQKLYVTMFPCNECAKIIVQVRKHQPQMSEIPIRFLEPQSSTSETNDARWCCECPLSNKDRPLTTFFAACCVHEQTRLLLAEAPKDQGLLGLFASSGFGRAARAQRTPRDVHTLPAARSVRPPAPPPPAVTRALHAINTCTSAAALASLRDGIFRDPALLRNTAVVSAFFLACGRLRHHGPALALFASIPRPHVFVFNSLLRSLTAPPCSPLPLFRHFLRIGVRAPTATPSRSCSPTSPPSATSASCTPSFQALATLRRMLASSVSPNRVTMVSALGACAAHGAVDTGIWIHEYVKKHGWELDVVLGTVLVDMYGKCGRVMEAEGVFSKMVERNVYTWNAIIGALALAEDGKTGIANGSSG